MNIAKIKYLDCRERKNRKILLKEIMEILKVDKKPEKELLERFSKSVGKKYDMPVSRVVSEGEKIIVFMRVGKCGYTQYECHSYYESLCKHILLVKGYMVYSEMKVKQ